MTTRDLDAYTRELLAAADGMPVMLKRVAVRTAIKAEREAKLNATGRVLQKRTGGLARSITSHVRFTRGAYEVAVRASHISASTHEDGAIIRPRRARMLAIPVGPAKTAGGVARYSTPRSVPGLFLIKSKKGNLLLVKREGDRLQAYFVLKHSVRIKRRPFVKPAARSAWEDLHRVLGQEFVNHYRKQQGATNG